jgi:hypothetical protein
VKPTGTRGEQHPHCRLTTADVVQIIERIRMGERQKVIAYSFGVDQQHISKIKLGLRWRCLGQDIRLDLRTRKKRKS